MREESRNYVVVGGFVLAMLVGLLYWIAVLSGRTGATDPYFIVYDQVMGLARGSQVMYEGYAVGVVDRIGPVERDGRLHFRVDVNVRRGWRIAEDSRAGITAPGFLSAYVINIRGGESELALEPGSEIPGESAANVLEVAAETVEELRVLMDEKVAPILDDFAEGVPEIVANLRSFSGELDQSGRRLNAVLAPQNVDRVSSILVNLDGTASELSSFANSLSVTRSQLDTLLTRANALLEEDTGKLDHAITDLHDSLEAVARHSDAIAHDLEETSRNLSEFSRQLRENPSVLIRGRDGGDGAGSP